MNTIKGAAPRLSDMRGYLVAIEPSAYVEARSPYGVRAVMHCAITVLAGPAATVRYPGPALPLNSPDILETSIPARFPYAAIAARGLVEHCRRNGLEPSVGRVYRWESRNGHRGWGLELWREDAPLIEAWRARP